MYGTQKHSREMMERNANQQINSACCSTWGSCSSLWCRRRHRKKTGLLDLRNPCWRGPLRLRIQRWKLHLRPHPLTKQGAGEAEVPLPSVAGTVLWGDCFHPEVQHPVALTMADIHLTSMILLYDPYQILLAVGGHPCGLRDSRSSRTTTDTYCCRRHPWPHGQNSRTSRGLHSLCCAHIVLSGS